MSRDDTDTLRRPVSREGPLSPRAWRFSLLIAAALVGAGLVLSATINPILGRQVHWDWAAVLATVSFVFLALAIRLRWV